MSLQFVKRGIGCILIMLLVLSVQAINYEVHRHDVAPTKLNSNIILTNRDLLEQLNHVTTKANYTMQEGTERLLYFGALLRTRILDTFGNLLYIYYDDFSIKEVEALHKVYQAIFERRYDVFNLVPAILKNPDTKPSKICAAIYTYLQAEPCLKSNANICRRIRKQHDPPHHDNLSTSARLNITYLAYSLFKISKQYFRGFSLAALLKLLQREVLTITPDLLSGLLCNVRYDNFDDDVCLAERKLIQSFHNITQPKIQIPLPELKKFRTVNSFLKYYVNVYAERTPDDDLKRHASLIRKRIVDDVGTINENIHLLGNVYENRTIHIKYLFDLVLPDDLLDNDVIEAKRYLVKKLNEFDVVEKYLKVQKYQQATPAQLTMEITGQLKDIDFAKSIAISLRIHARFWRSSRMIENLDELLELFDAYENLRQIPRYDDVMQKIDSIKKNLWDIRDIPVEILCNAPRACLQIGLRSILNCKYVSYEIKELIKEFLKLSNICVVPVYVTEDTSRRSVDIPFKISKTHFYTRLANVSAIWNTGMQKGKNKLTNEATTHPSSTQFITDNYDESENTYNYESEETTESAEISKKSTKSSKVLSESKTSSEESAELTNTTATTISRTIAYLEPISTTMIMDKTSTIQEETIMGVTGTTAVTTTVSPTTTTVSSVTTTSPTTTTASPMTTTASPATTTTLPTTITTLPTISTTLPSTTIPTTTIMPITTSTLPTTTTTLPTTIILSTTTTTLPTTTITTLPTTTNIFPLVETISTTTELPTLNIEMALEHSNIKTINNLYDEEEITQSPTSASTKFCESDECSSEESLEEISEKTTTQASTLESTLSTFSELSSTTSQDFVITETAVISTTDGLNETLVTEEGCKSESVEASGTSSCETSCDSVDCEGEDSALKDVSEKVENHTVKCSKVRCKEIFSSECETETDKSCECDSKGEKSIECTKLCPSNEESSSCEGSQANCSNKSEVPPVTSTKLENTTKKRGICEIRDPHHRRQMKRLAKMRAISVTAAASHADVFKSLRHRIASKKLYNLLAAKLSHLKDDKSSRIAEYLLKRPLRNLSRIEGANRRRRKQQE